MKRRNFPIRGNAFSLIEVLVAVIALSIVGFAAAGLLFNTFKNSSKTQVVGTVKQNGQNIFNLLTDPIRDASSVVCVTGPILVVKSGGTYIRFRMIPPVTAPPASAANGYIIEDQLVINFEPATPPELASLCVDPPPPPPPPPGNSVVVVPNSGQTLTDTDKISGVSVDSGSFQVSGSYQSQNAADRPVVTINFTLKQGVNASTDEENSVGTNGVPFQTSVQLR